MIRTYKQEDKGSAPVTMDWGKGQVHIVVGNITDVNCVTLSNEVVMQMILDLLGDKTLSAYVILQLLRNMDIWKVRRFADELLDFIKNSEELPEWAKEF